MSCPGHMPRAAEEPHCRNPFSSLLQGDSPQGLMSPGNLQPWIWEETIPPARVSTVTPSAALAPWPRWPVPLHPRELCSPAFPCASRGVPQFSSVLLCVPVLRDSHLPAERLQFSSREQLFLILTQEVPAQRAGLRQSHGLGWGFVSPSLCCESAGLSGQSALPRASCAATTAGPARALCPRGHSLCHINRHLQNGI